MSRKLLILGLILAFSPAVRAADDDAAKIIEKTLKAHFPKGLDKKNEGLITKSKGTVHVMGLDIDFSQEVVVKLPNKFKETSEMTVMNNKINVTSIFNGKDAFIRANDMDVPANDDIVNEFKEAANMIGMMQGTFLKEKDLKFSLVGESKVKDKPVIGVNISREGKKDVNLYVDKATHLIAKFEVRKKDLQSGQEVNEERIFVEYKEVDGRKVAKKVEILRDGKPYMEMELLEVSNLEKVDDKEFDKPK